MTDNHPIIPPNKLVQQWVDTEYDAAHIPYTHHIARCAAQWGSDQQLAEDAKWLDQHALDAPHLKITPVGKSLIEAMRPNPLILKEQALEALQFVDEKLKGHLPLHSHCNAIHTINRALEQLND